MSVRGPWLRRALLASVTLVVASGCGQVTDQRSPTIADSGASGSLGASGSPGAAGTAELGGVAGTLVEPNAVALDTSACDTLPISDCKGVQSDYSSARDAFDETPELARCSMFNSWDGCARIQFTFDAQGCAATVAWYSPGRFETLPELRQCLTTALQSARWPCLALGALRYAESCFIH